MVKRVIRKVSNISAEQFKGAARETIDRHISFLERTEKFLYEPPLIKVPLILLSIFVLDLIFTAIMSNNSILFHSTRAFLLLFVSVYLVLFIIHLMRRSFRRLFTAKNLWALFFAYALFIFSIILFFSSIYDTVEKLDLGYLKYGQCSDTYTEQMEDSDILASHQYFYFSSVTIFTVGYGDICPMGAARTVAVINSFIGNFINVVLMVFVISNFLKRRENGDS